MAKRIRLRGGRFTANSRGALLLSEPDECCCDQDEPEIPGVSACNSLAAIASQLPPRVTITFSNLTLLDPCTTLAECRTWLQNTPLVWTATRGVAPPNIPIYNLDPPNVRVCPQSSLVTAFAVGMSCFDIGGPARWQTNVGVGRDLGARNGWSFAKAMQPSADPRGTYLLTGTFIVASQCLPALTAECVVT